MGAIELTSFDLSDDARKAWGSFLDNSENRGHAQRMLAGTDINEHVLACMQSSRLMALRIKKDIQGLEPENILEVGSSAGLNCYALQEVYPNAKVVGIEPETEANAVARSMLNSGWTLTPNFIQGVGEKIPLADGSVDLIICHTVIEHVKDVPMVIKEFARLLTDRGIVHLDAPNYIWPYEPHLQIWTIPKFGKQFVRWSAKTQGKIRTLDFLDHLQFVTPFQLQHLFNENGLAWENRAERKFLDAINGTADIKRYNFVSKALVLLGRIGVARFIVTLAISFGLYPSVMYTLHKARVNRKT